MEVGYEIKYSRVWREGVSPARYVALRKGNKIIAHITLHPILRKYPDLRIGVLQHETNEIAAWARGNTASHRYANDRESRVTKQLGGVKGFWKEIKLRRQERR